VYFFARARYNNRFVLDKIQNSEKGKSMRTQRSLRYVLLFIAAVFATAAVAQAATVRSSARNQRSAVMEYGGFYLMPIGTEPEGPGDLAPPQLFQLIRPNDQAIRLGRLYTSCVCVALETEKTDYAAGEPVVLRLRNIKLSPPAGQMYAIYVQISSPVRTILRADTFLQSSQFIPSKPGEAPTRGDIVVDGVLETPVVEAAASASTAEAEKTTGDDGIEIIVPKADNYIPDTSEYTLRKQAEEAEAAGEKVEEAVEEAAEAAANESISAAKDAAVKARAAKLNAE
jgi:hypothetical protein